MSINKKKLLIENFDTCESAIEKGNGGDLFIKGIFAQSGIVNRNGRVYPENLMDKQINEYDEQHIQRSHALGELNHPTDRIPVDPGLASHNIVELKKEGKDYIGKAKILKTPRGEIVRGLLEGGVLLGVSTRGYGSVRKNSKQISEVQNDYKMVCVDIVYQPSAPDAFVEAIVESEIIETTFESHLIEKEFQEFLKFKQLIKEQKTLDEREVLSNKLLTKCLINLF